MAKNANVSQFPQTVLARWDQGAGSGNQLITIFALDAESVGAYLKAIRDLIGIHAHHLLPNKQRIESALGAHVQLQNTHPLAVGNREGVLQADSAVEVVSLAAY